MPLGIGWSFESFCGQYLYREFSSYAADNVGVASYIMGSVGLVAAARLYVYGLWTCRLKE